MSLLFEKYPIIFDGSYKLHTMKEYFYEVHLSRKTDRKGLLSAHGLQEVETFSSGIPLKEKKKRWTPEQLLAGALSSCFMTAYLDCAEKTKLELTGYHSQCFVKIEKSDTGYITTAILLRPVIILTNDKSAQLANTCIDEAEKIYSLNKLLTIPVHIDPKFEYTA